VCVSQTLRLWTEGTTYIRQGDHHVGHWPTFLVPADLSIQLTPSFLRLRFGFCWPLYVPTYTLVCHRRDRYKMLVTNQSGFCHRPSIWQDRYSSRLRDATRSDCHRDVRQRKSGDVRSRDCPLLLLSQRDFQTNSIMRRELQHLNQRLVFSWKAHEPVQSSRFAHGIHTMNLVCRAIDPMCVCVCVSACLSVSVCLDNNFWTKCRLTSTYGVLVDLDTIYVKVISRIRRSQEETRTQRCWKGRS